MKTEEKRHKMIALAPLAVICSAIDLSMFATIFNVRIGKNDKIKFVIINSLIIIISSILMPFIYSRMINAISTIILLKLISNKSIEKCILCETINSLTIVCPEVIFLKLFYSFYNYNKVNLYNLKMNNLIFLLSVIVPVIILRAIFVCILRYKKINVYIKGNLLNQTKKLIIKDAIISFFMIYIIFIQTVIIIDKTSILSILISVFIVCLYLKINVKNIEKTVLLEEQYIQISNLQNYNQNLLAMYDNVRGFKHDFSNFVQALDGFVRAKDIDGIRNMNNGILKDCISIKNLEILNPNIINNSAVYNIITNKYYLAQEQGITMNIEILINLKEMNICSYELCRILAILLDNAIEAASNCKDNKVINLKFEKDGKVSRKLLIVENSYDNADIDIDKIFEKGYSSKGNEDGNPHGLGLWNVRKILSHTENLNLFTYKTDLFVQQLEIYD